MTSEAVTPVSTRFSLSLLLRLALGALGLALLFSYGPQLWAGPLLVPLMLFGARKSKTAGEIMFTALAAVLAGQVVALGLALVVADGVLGLLLALPVTLALWVVFHRIATGRQVWHRSED
jgi:hypothetical protein